MSRRTLPLLLAMAAILAASSARPNIVFMEEEVAEDTATRLHRQRRPTPSRGTSRTFYFPEEEVKPQNPVGPPDGSPDQPEVQPSGQSGVQPAEPAVIPDPPRERPAQPEGIPFQTRGSPLKHTPSEPAVIPDPPRPRPPHRPPRPDRPRETTSQVWEWSSPSRPSPSDTEKVVIEDKPVPRPDETRSERPPHTPEKPHTNVEETPEETETEVSEGSGVGGGDSGSSIITGGSGSGSSIIIGGDDEAGSSSGSGSATSSGTGGDGSSSGGGGDASSSTGSGTGGSSGGDGSSSSVTGSGDSASNRTSFPSTCAGVTTTTTVSSKIFFPGQDVEPIPDCGGEQFNAYDNSTGKCRKLWTDAGCPPGTWYVQERYTGMASCQPRCCPPGYALFEDTCWKTTKEIHGPCAPGMGVFLDQFGEGFCDCLLRQVYWPAEQRCYPIYGQGPCPAGQHVGLTEGKRRRAVCKPNVCPEGQVFWGDESAGVPTRCYTPEELRDNPCERGGKLTVDWHTLELYCQNTALHAVFDPPQVRCPAGSFLDFSGQCRDELVQKFRSSFAVYDQPASRYDQPPQCPNGFVAKGSSCVSADGTWGGLGR